jgi:hypothetical protein
MRRGSASGTVVQAEDGLPGNIPATRQHWQDDHDDKARDPTTRPVHGTIWTRRPERQPGGEP